MKKINKNKSRGKLHPLPGDQLGGIGITCSVIKRFSCPSGRIWSVLLRVAMAVCLFLYLLPLHLTLQVASAGSSPLKCGLRSKLCKDGSECVLYNYVCDGEPDCKDGSDEEDCATVCNQDQFQCAHGKKCIDKDQVCDGVPQCQDRSDELDCVTRTDGCVHHCDDKNRCLPASLLCDGERDCLDGTDEENCESEDEDKVQYEKKVTSTTSKPIVSGSSFPIKCSLGSKPCRDGTDCVLYNHECDGEDDCKDGSDEDECPISCEMDQFQCAHRRKCIEQSQVCDGVPQCQDRSDELQCAKITDGCSHQCDDKSRCLPNSFLCDGERDCADGSDEANCTDRSCSDMEFKCTSGQCVWATMRCDGRPDCWDHSDEENCIKAPICTTKYRCPHSKECLVQEWMCDGEDDCKDGTDEKDCPAAPLNCGDYQWSCQSKTQCVPTAWRCDGLKDCDDDSDENECDVTCLPHQFQCGSQECLDSVLVCNGITNCADGSDEEGDCQINCSDAQNSRCSHGCYSTPQGPRCSCGAGFQLMDDGVTCADVDECEVGAGSSRMCSQHCINAPGSYQCACHLGFVKEAHGLNCKTTGEPLLLASVQTDLFLLGVRSGSLDVFSSSAKRAVLSLDYDWSEQKVYWACHDTESIRWSSLDQKTTGTLTKGVRADSVAVDWIGKNLYWIDGVNSQIVAIKLDAGPVKSRDHSVILDEDLDQPRSLALLPQKGLMFWSEIGNVEKIERAGMDGSERQVVVNSSLGWPGGVAVDAISDRVYWTDERLRAIGSATLDGDDIRILQMRETTNPFSLAVFNDMLYWSDPKRRVVQVAHKITGKNHRVLLKRPRQPFAVKIIHPTFQMSTKNPCKKTDCSHLCVLAPGPKAVCKCPSGLHLAEDSLTCSSLVNSAFLLMLSPSTVTQIYLQARHTAFELKGWPEHLALQLPDINDAAIMDYSLPDHTLFLTDDGTTSLSSFKLKDFALISHSQRLKLQGDAITAMALDWITLNIYWSSNKQPRLQVTSITGGYSAVLISEGIGRVESIALHPPTGRVCFNNLGLQDTGTTATIECANMDGAERSVVWKDAAQPTSLIFSSNGDTIHWADTNLGVIGSIELDGSGYTELKAGAGLSAVAHSDDMLLWMTVSDKTRLWYRDEQQQHKLWFEVGTKVVSLKIFSKSSQTGSNQCAENNGNCQQLCLATPGGRTCKCAHDHIMVNTTHCGPEQGCPDGSRPCMDLLSCQPVEKFCNGRVDCSDNSDENCVNLKQWFGIEASPPIQYGSSSSPTSTPLSEDKGINATLDTSRLLNLDSKTCSEGRCSGSGRCAEVNGDITCVCSLGYTGDSCQDHLLKTMQKPIMYGAAALCAVVVVVIVIAVVVKRKKNSNIRQTSSAAVKETSMTDLENKAETAPRTQTSAADSEKQEEAVSSVD